MSLTALLTLIGVSAVVLGAVLVGIGYYRAAHPPTRKRNAAS